MTRELIYQTIQKYINDIYGIRELELKTSINSFNAVSEDNDEFLRRYQKEFNVDMSKFDYYDFFDEDQIYSLALVNLVLRLFGKQKKKLQLTIEHLVEVAQKGKWSQPS